MNLKRISVSNFKSLYHASFEPGKVNVFVGANGSGKSTILEAFQYDVHLTTPKDADYWKYHSEAFFVNKEKRWGRSNASQKQSNNYIGFF